MWGLALIVEGMRCGSAPIYSVHRAWTEGLQKPIEARHQILWPMS